MKALLLSFLLGGCVLIDAGTAYQLSKLDPLTANPEGFAIIVFVPEQIDIPAKDARLVFEWTNGDIHLGGPFEMAAQAAPTTGGIPVPENMVAYYYDLPPQAEAEIVQIQKQVTLHRSLGEEGKGSLGISLSACQKNDDPAEALIVSVFLRIEPDADFLPIMREHNLENLLANSGHTKMGPCR